MTLCRQKDGRLYKISTGGVKVTESTSVTEPGRLAADARQLNAALPGTLANRIAGMNGAYRVRKVLLENITMNQTAWMEVPAFTYTVPQKSLVMAQCNFNVSRARRASTGFFLLDTFFLSSVEEAGAELRINTFSAFMADRNLTVKVEMGADADNPVTVHGNTDNRIAKVDYIVIPLE